MNNHREDVEGLVERVKRSVLLLADNNVTLAAADWECVQDNIFALADAATDLTEQVAVLQRQRDDLYAALEAAQSWLRSAPYAVEREIVDALAKARGEPWNAVPSVRSTGCFEPPFPSVTPANEGEALAGIASRVEAKIEALGLTLREAAEATGVSKDTLSRVIRSKTPTLATYQRLEAWVGELDR